MNAPSCKPHHIQKRSINDAEYSNKTYIRPPLVSEGCCIVCKHFQEKFVANDIFLRHLRASFCCPGSQAQSTAHTKMLVHFVRNAKHTTGKQPNSNTVIQTKEGLKIKIGWWLNNMRGHYDHGKPFFTESHLKALKDAGITWPFYPPMADTNHVVFLQNCRKAELYVSVLSAKGYKVPVRFTCPVTKWQVGKFIDKECQRYKRYPDSYPPHRSKALSSIGITWPDYDNLKVLRSENAISAEVELYCMQMRMQNGPQQGTPPSLSSTSSSSSSSPYQDPHTMVVETASPLEQKEPKNIQHQRLDLSSASSPPTYYYYNDGPQQI